MDYRNAIAQSIMNNRQRQRRGNLLQPIAPLGTGAPVNVQPQLIGGAPPQRTPQGPTTNPLLAGYRAAAGPTNEDVAEWGQALTALRNKWNEPTSSDKLEEYIYGDREMGPR